MPSSRLIGLGVFVLGGFVLFAVGLFMIGDRRMLFREEFELYANFTSVSALQSGATVRVGGLSAGEVLEIQVPASPSEPFRVRMRVAEDLHPLVREDSVATIQTDGLVGNKFVQIEGGSERAPVVPDGGTVPTKEPFDLAALMDQMSATVTNVNETITDLRGQIEGAIGDVVETVNNADELIQDVGVDVRRIGRSGAVVMEDVETIVRHVRQGEGTIGKLINDDSLYEHANRIAASAEDTMDQAREVVQNVNEMTGEARGVLAEFREADGPVHGLAADFRQTLGYARELMGDLSENAEALKRNWFFRGFFRDRGYYDLNALTEAEYQEDVLTRKTPLRIWLHDSVLFEQTPDGELSLTEAGRRRIDSAMASFLRFSKAAPIVVEGYDTEGTRDQRFREAHRQAALVRDYLVATYHRSPNTVGVVAIPGGSREAPGDVPWNGVALTLLTTEEELERSAPRPVPAVAADQVGPQG